MPTPVYMQFPLFAKNCGTFFYCHYSAQIMDSDRGGVLLPAVSNLFTSNAKHFCMVVFRAGK